MNALTQADQRLRRKLFRELLRETNRVPPVNHIDFQPFDPAPEGVELQHLPFFNGNLSHTSSEGELNLSVSSEELDQERIMADQAQREAMRHVDAAKRVYKSLQPPAFPTNELEVIPWVSNYEEYIRRVYGEGDAFKVEHIITHVPPTVFNFVRGMDQWADIKRYILELTGPSSERKHTLIKGLMQKAGEDCHAFCRRVLEACGQVGRVEPEDILNVYKDGLLSGVREKLILADHDNLNGLARAAQGAYETFKASTENTDRLNALEAHIKSVGGKVESVPEVMDKLVSVLKINEKMLAPIHQTVPQHTAPNQTQIDQSYIAPQGSGSPAIECWNCKGNHFQVGCPLLPSLSRRERGGNRSFRAQHRGSERGNGRGNFRQNNGRYSTPQGGYNQGSGFRGGWQNGGGQNNHSGGRYSNQDYTGTHRGGNSQQDVSPTSKVNSLTKEQCVEVAQMMLQLSGQGN